MEKLLNQILAKLDSMELKLNELYERKDKIEDSHEWLSSLHHSNQVH